MTYLELRPRAEALRPLVELIWVMETAPGVELPPERVVPDGLLELVLQYGSPMEVRHDGEVFRRQPTSSLVSQTRRFVEFRSAGGVGMVSVRFKPGGGHHFVAPPLSALSDLVVPASDVFPRSEIGRLEDELAAAGAVSERVDRVERFLLTALRRYEKRRVDPLLAAVWRGRGLTRVRDLSRDLGVGERSLERAFAASLGTTPKSYSRLVRFLGACAMLRRGAFANLAEVGHECGYFDQAHFIAECRQFSGMAPAALAAAPQLSFYEPR